MRTKIVAGNWKLNGSRDVNRALLNTLAPTLPSGVEVLVVPPLPYLEGLIREYAGKGFAFGAQDVGVHVQGAFTGDVAAEMLADIGCRYVLVGHSERRQYQQESSELVAEKFMAAKRAGLVPVLCVGESLHQREAGHTEWVIEKQLKPVFELGGAQAFAGAVIAYEPVWAIGTGKNATPAEADEAHRYVRGRLREWFSPDAAAACRVLYGGSVKPDNVKELMALPDVDGALVGGASLEVASFFKIVQNGRDGHRAATH